MKQNARMLAHPSPANDCAGAGAASLRELARTAYEARRARERIFGASLFADPAWDLLLYLFLATEDGRDVTVTEACRAASVPTTTALRCLMYLVDRQLVLRVVNPRDRRAALVCLSLAGREKMAEFLRMFPCVPAGAL